MKLVIPVGFENLTKIISLLVRDSFVSYYLETKLSAANLFYECRMQICKCFSMKKDFQERVDIFQAISLVISNICHMTRSPDICRKFKIHMEINYCFVYSCMYTYLITPKFTLIFVCTCCIYNV